MHLAATALHAPGSWPIAKAEHVLPQLCMGCNFPSSQRVPGAHCVTTWAARFAKAWSARARRFGKRSQLLCSALLHRHSALGLGLIAPPSIGRCTLNAFLLSGITVITVSLRGVYVDMLAKQHVWLTML